MAKTVVEKITSPRPDVTIFKIIGTLGFHENEVLTRFFSQCRSRNITKLVLDFSALTSLGGGCAAIIRDAAAAGEVVICIVGALKTVRNFLENKGATAVLFEETLSGAIAKLDRVGEAQPQGAALPSSPLSGSASADSAATRGESQAKAPNPTRSSRPAPVPPAPPPPSRLESTPARWEVPVSDTDCLEELDDMLGVRPQKSPPGSSTLREPVARSVPEAVPAERWASEPPDIHTRPREGEQTEAPARAARPPEAPAAETASRASARTAEHGAPTLGEEEARTLQRKIVQYRSLFSLNREFNRLRDRNKLLDAFLLTTIAQVGVESGAFLESLGEEFVAVCWKGFETADPSKLCIHHHEIDVDAWRKAPQIFPLERAPLSDDARERLKAWSMPYIAPFLVYDNFRGIVLLGRPIRKVLDDDSWEFLSMLINQAAIAYEHTRRFEEESRRTLGIVHSLISMIEENTLSRGSTDLLVSYTYALAHRLHYPEEFVRDLLYGAVLRDIGMIKVSDLILRSPRELDREEWEIIKKHPVEGAEMLRKMRFSEHTIGVVKCHHERYNGEGYPGGLEGDEIPLGARVVSVVESYLAMLQDRPTRPALSREEALNTLKENWGLRYDPQVIGEFVDVVEEEIRSGRPVKYEGVELFRL